MKKVVLSGILLSCLFVLKAQDRFFARTYTSNVLPKGNIDVELWHTSRFGHEGEFFHAMDQRMEFEVGLGRNWQTAFYFNRFQKTIGTNLGGLTTTSEVGFSNEWKWKLSDPSSNKLGSALYGEWAIKGDELEWEAKIILDKYIGNSLFAFNLVGEIAHEFKRENGHTKFTFAGAPIELDFAYMYNLNTNWGIGLEIRNHNEISKTHGWENSVWFGGPTINFRSSRWFAIANFSPQWVNMHKTSESPNSKVLDVNERMEARILLGFSF